MKNKMILILICLINSAWASVPTTEGLFRNNSNSDVGASLVMVTLQAQKELSKKALEQPVSESPVKENQVLSAEDERIEKVNIKYLFSVNDNDEVEVITITYKTGDMSDSNILGVKYYKNLNSAVLNSPNQKGLILGLLSSLALNRSQEISSFFKKVSTNYKSNQDLIDPEKKDLYVKYKKYLKLIKEDESLKESLENPLEPQDEEIKKTVDLIKERPFLQKDPHVELEKKDSHFLWKVDLDVVDALFDGKSQHLLKLDYTKPDEKVAISLDDYILFNGSNELPKTIKVDTTIHTYTLRTSSHVQLNLGTKSMWQRFSEYEEKVKENKKLEKIDFFFL